MPCDWMGTLVNNDREFRIILHIRESAEGGVEGTLDNIDLGCTGISVDDIVLNGTTMRFSAAIGASYEGRLSADGHTADGNWRMDEDRSRLVLHRVAPSEIDGIWCGVLSVRTLRLRLVFYIASGPHGLIGAMKSRDQDQAVVPLSAVRRVGSALILEAASIVARFDGALNAALDQVEGTWEQGGVRLPLRLKRVAEEEEERPRPQEPAEPYPYRELEARYRNPRADVELAGTLTIPEGPGPFPAVLLISGSGKHDRNGSMYGHRPFLVLADFLTRRGVAVLRTDDRGVGESGGDFRQANTSDLATDAEAALDWLRGRPEVSPASIGIIGHSEGALIAQMVASRDPGVAFIVLMAGPGIPGWEIFGRQARRQAELYGADGDSAGELTADVVAILRNQKEEASLRHLLHQRLSGVPDEHRTRLTEHYSTPWMRHFVGLDPAEFLREVRCPVLALNGSKDVYLEPRENLETIRVHLETGGNRRFETIELPGLNHMLQTCETGAPTEYAQIEETLAPAAMEKIAAWVMEQAS